MTEFRFSVLSAVSREDQATEDKDSLDHQYRTARAYGERMGGVFIREYRAEGFSRSGYYDLSQALDDIPAFGEMAGDARAHKIDVILVESYDRLGDLGYMIFNYLSFIGAPFVQLRSVQQALPIEDPALYHPRKDDSTPMMINNSLTINRYRTSKIVRAFEVGSAKRARDGKYSNAIPYGYIRKNKDEVILDPPVASIIARFPEWYLSGVTPADIARRANEAGILTRFGKPWRRNTVTYILQNPFYAGKTFFGRHEQGANPTNYKQRENFDLYDGKHEPLWSWDTHLQIMAEARRRQRYRSKPTDYALTRMLTCSVCGAHLSVNYSSTKSKHKTWRCLNGGHVYISHAEAARKVADELARLLQDLDYSPTPEKESQDFSRRELAKIESQIRRTEQAYDAGAYTPAEYAGKMQGLKARRDELQDATRQQEEARRRIADREKAFGTLRELLPHLHEWLSEAPARLVNYHLQRTVRFTVYPDKTVRGELL